MIKTSLRRTYARLSDWGSALGIGQEAECCLDSGPPRQYQAMSCGAQCVGVCSRGRVLTTSNHMEKNHVEFREGVVYLHIEVVRCSETCNDPQWPKYLDAQQDPHCVVGVSHPVSCTHGKGRTSLHNQEAYWKSSRYLKVYACDYTREVFYQGCTHPQTSLSDGAYYLVLKSEQNHMCCLQMPAVAASKSPACPKTSGE